MHSSMTVAGTAKAGVISLQGHLHAVFTCLFPLSVCSEFARSCFICRSARILHLLTLSLFYNLHMKLQVFYRAASSACLGPSHNALLLISCCCQPQGTNPIYNLLPDMLSSLAAEPSLAAADFQSIMRTLLGYIGKDRHADALVEKLLARFEGVSQAPLWRNLAFCLSQVSTHLTPLTLSPAFGRGPPRGRAG